MDQHDLIYSIKKRIEALKYQGLPCIFIYANNPLNIPTIFGDYQLVKRINVDREFRGIAYWIQCWLRRGEQVGVSYSFCCEVLSFYVVSTIMQIVYNIPNGNIDRCKLLIP